MLKFSDNELTFERAMKLEWLETNGLGGYACGTIAGVRTRRYHGLLVASLRPPTQRTLLFASTDEQIVCGDRTYALTAHLFLNGATNSWTPPTEFEIDWSPKWTYELAETKIVKRVFMPHMRNAVAVRYFVQPKGKVSLFVRLLVAWRDHHWTMRPFVPFSVEVSRQFITVRPSNDEPTPVCHFAHNGDDFRPELVWWHNFWLPIETERGLEDLESLFCVGAIVKEFHCDGHFDIVSSVEPLSVDEVPDLENGEMERRGRLTKKLGGDEFLANLLRAADAFIALRSSTGTRTIIAGYPWFTDWGRDALISLSGLTLVTRRFPIAREILLTFAQNISDGMVPNFFPEVGENPAYNTVDATLWFVIATYRYLRYTRDEGLLKSLWENLREILLRHLSGTRYGICADPKDGLLSWGTIDQPEALTWMDAKVLGNPVTPRKGKPVEVNALWCNTLAIIARLARQFGDGETEKLANRWAEKAMGNFEPVFWNEGKGCLFDAINPNGEPDPSVRCNQLLALSLPFRLISLQKEKAVLHRVETDLLTPCGLRTLSPQQPQYVGRYLGPPHERDAAYHQGTVWAWWFGPYADAVSLVEGNGSVRKKIRPLLAKFLTHHLREACIGQVSEIFDGDEPNEPRGCFAQAWSVAEILRAWVERVLGKRPKPLWDER